METKFARKLTEFRAALENFRQSAGLDPAGYPEIIADNIKAGQIQKFEFTLELLWKTLQAFLAERDGLDVNSPKTAAREFFRAGHCSTELCEAIISAINDRNLLSHVYNQQMAENFRLRLTAYADMFGEAEKIMTGAG